MKPYTLHKSWSSPRRIGIFKDRRWKIRPPSFINLQTANLRFQSCVPREFMDAVLLSNPYLIIQPFCTNKKGRISCNLFILLCVIIAIPNAYPLITTFHFKGKKGNLLQFYFFLFWMLWPEYFWHNFCFYLWTKNNL